jgi:hypothetical protein
MRRPTARLAAFALAVGLAVPAVAQEDLDELLGGFEEEPSEPVAPQPAEESEPERLPAWLDAKGSLSLGASYGLVAHRTAALPHRKSYQGLNRLRTKLDLELNAELPGDLRARVSGFGFYDASLALRDRTEYESDAREVYERELELEELWLRGSPHPRVDVKVGRQVLNWGRSDTLRVIDVINPLDNRDPGLTDIENLRRPVGMLRTDAFAGDWTATGLLIAEWREDVLPPFGSDFVASPTPLPRTRAPDHFGDDPEFGGALSGVFSGWDVSFHALRHWTNTPRLAAIPSATPGPPRLEFRHDRRTLLGSGANLALGNWLLKAELAWIDGVRFSNAEESERIDAMGGIEYYGFDDASIALEVVNRHLTDWELAAKRAPDFAEEDSLELALRMNADYFNARLHLLGLVIVLGERAQNGVIGRAQATWELRDALEITGGVLIFAKGDDPPFDVSGDNDRLFAELRWSF